MAGRIDRYPGFAPGIDTVYVYAHEDDIIPSSIMHVISEKKKSADKNATATKESTRNRMRKGKKLQS